MADDGTPQTAVTWVYEHSKHKGNVYQVLRTLAEAYNAKGACLSMKEIAHRTKVSQPTARRALEKLQADKTITIDRNGGEKRGTGITNCYRIPGFDTPVTHSDTPLSDDVTPTITEVTPPDLIPPLSSGDTPAAKSEPHVHAAGEQLLLSQSSPVLSEKQKTGPDLEANSEQDTPPVNTPATPYAESLAAAPPEIQADADALIAKAQPVDSDVSSTPPPNSAEAPAPESPEAHDYWRSQLPGFGLSTGYKTRLNTAVKKYGFDAVKDAINAARLEGSRLDYPMAWIERRLEGQETEGKLPGKSKPAQKRFVSRTHLQGSDLKPPKDYPDEMQFEPPPPKAETKGAIAAWS